MEGPSTTGVLSHLTLLEDQEWKKKRQLKEQKAKIEALKSQKQRLKAKLQIHKELQKLRTPVVKLEEDEEDKKMDVDAKSSELPHLMGRYSELRDLLDAHSLDGILRQLNLLEDQARSQGRQLKELKAKVETLKSQKPQLKAELQIDKELQKLRTPVVNLEEDEEDKKMDVDAKSSELPHLMGRYSELRDLLDAHSLIGGYNAIATNGGKSMCFSLATEYEGVYLDTYNLELSLKPNVRIIRHNIPPFIPLDTLAEQSDLQTDVRAFLATVSQHLNALASRRQQLKLVKEQHKFVEVIESNLLGSILVLMITVPKEKTSFLCKLMYADRSRCLPTEVYLKCLDELVPNFPKWQKRFSLLWKVPVHTALTAIRKYIDTV